MNSTEKPQKKSVAQYAPLLLLGTALLSVLLIFGVSFARYIKTQDQTILLKSQSGTGVYLLQGSGGFSAPGDWVREEEGDGYLLSFRLSNAAAQQSYPAGDVRAQLFVVASVQDNGAAVTLRVGDAVYTARAEKIERESYLGRRYGDGTLYRFYDGQTEPLTFALPGGALSAVSMELHVDGAAAPNTTYTLIAQNTEFE